MMTNDLPMPMDEILSLAEHLVKKHSLPGENAKNVPAYSEALYGAVQAINKFNDTPPEDRKNGRGLVWACMQNRIIDAGRKTQRFYRTFGVSINEEIVGEGSVDSAYEKQELLQSIISSYEWTEEDKRRWGWAVDVYTNNMTFREVAERENLSVTVVKSKVHRLMTKLREVANRKAG